MTVFCFLEIFGVFPLHILKRDSNENGDIFELTILSWPLFETNSVDIWCCEIALSIITTENWLCLFIMTENWLFLLSRQKTDWSTTLLIRHFYQVSFWCWIKSLQDAVLYSFHLLDWDLPPWKSMKLSSSFDSFDVWNGANHGDAHFRVLMEKRERILINSSYNALFPREKIPRGII